MPPPQSDSVSSKLQSKVTQFSPGPPHRALAPGDLAKQEVQKALLAQQVQVQLQPTCPSTEGTRGTATLILTGLVGNARYAVAPILREAQITVERIQNDQR